MGNGCLKPSPRTGQIYIDCINQIYEQVKLITDLQSKNGQQMYALIKEKIHKKGWLRKLMDYLTSHRSSISQAALHNFRLLVQTKGVQFKITGLIIIDYIINAVLRQSGLEVADQMGEIIIKMMIKQKDINAQSIYQQSQHKRQAVPSNNNPKSNILITSPSLQNIQNQQFCTHNTQPHSNPYTIPQPNHPNYPHNQQQNSSLMLRQIYNVKFSNVFYNMIHSLISTEDGLYLNGIKSIIAYTRHHTVSNIQQEKIIDIMQILVEHIQTGENMTQSLKAYEMLLHKLRDTFLQNQIKQLKNFLKIWEHSFVLANDQQNQTYYKNIQNRLLLQAIIEKMISSMIGSMAVNKIYEQIILVYDQHKFQNMIHFEEMLITVTKKNELKNQFFRGLYSFLLMYLAVCKSTSSNQSTKNMSSLKQIAHNSPCMASIKWPCINSSKSFQTFISEYDNILQAKVKRNVIGTLKRWTKSYDFIEINQIIKYNSSLLLHSFLFNIHESFVSETANQSKGANLKSSSGNSSKVINTSMILQNNSSHLTNVSTISLNLNSKSFTRYLMAQFCQSFCQNAQIQQRISIVNQLYDEIHNSEVQDKQKMLYLQIINQLLYQEWIQSPKIIQFSQIDAQYSSSINQQLISLANILINKFTQKMVYKQIDQISYFLYSIFQILSKVSLSYQDFISITDSSIKLVQTVQRSRGALIVLAFTQRMIKAVNNQMDKQNFFSCWDLILNCAYILLSSPRNNQRQKTKKQLNEIYIKITQIEQLKTTINKIAPLEFDQKVQILLSDAFGQLTQTEQQQNLLNIQLPKPEYFENHKQQNTPSDKIYELSSIAFRDMFIRGVSIVKGGFLNIQDEDGLNFPSQTNGFGRINSIVREQDVGNEQKSIADVMDMINI